VILLGGLLVSSTGGAQTLPQSSQPKFPTTLPAPKTDAPAAAPADAAPAPAAPAASPNTPSGSRDPFEPLVQKPLPGEAGAARELTTLKLVAVIWYTTLPDQPVAMVEGPDGLGYYLRINDEKFGGKVVAIERDRVRFSVREQPRGQPARLRMVELRLPKPDGQ
jgi:hypothetical protein